MLEAADNLGNEGTEGMMRLEDSEGKMREGGKEGRKEVKNGMERE